MAHTYTCPNWVRHPINNLVCRLPGVGAPGSHSEPEYPGSCTAGNSDYQPCPHMFKVMKADEPGGEADLSQYLENQASDEGGDCGADQDNHCQIGDTFEQQTDEDYFCPKGTEPRTEENKETVTE